MHAAHQPRSRAAPCAAPACTDMRTPPLPACWPYRTLLRLHPPCPLHLAAMPSSYGKAHTSKQNKQQGLHACTRTWEAGEMGCTATWQLLGLGTHACHVNTGLALKQAPPAQLPSLHPCTTAAHSSSDVMKHTGHRTMACMPRISRAAAPSNGARIPPRFGSCCPCHASPCLSLPPLL
jgi:hypothetical protein